MTSRAVTAPSATRAARNGRVARAYVVSRGSTTPRRFISPVDDSAEDEKDSSGGAEHQGEPAAATGEPAAEALDGGGGLVRCDGVADERDLQQREADHVEGQDDQHRHCRPGVLLMQQIHPGDVGGAWKAEQDAD